MIVQVPLYLAWYECASYSAWDATHSFGLGEESITAGSSVILDQDS